ncbi:DUF3997 domain-containing protein [Paenibacillus sp. N3.4]|uniref:DUF3997 domain-containing protein n=1 Tax=Paenibacillus sp. N3.4 TaxID=2603222 RepID=UPI0011C7631C|nr:DUF3997 domain-containing protein [Paenibacillus sp. N3.4]TXK80055.1 DUF3997 domain-containing protein [Paenibacillus sp. N3.4]
MFFFLSGCAGLGDFDVKLPNSLSVVRTSAHQVTISPQTSESSWGAPLIPAKVVQVAWDEKYILVKQLSLKADPKSTNGYEIPDESKVSYWIIDSDSRVIGPMDEGDFNLKKKELEISEDVKLKDVRSYQS